MKLQREDLIFEERGFTASFYPLEDSEKAVLVITDHDTQNRLSRAVADWMHKRGCACLIMNGDQKQEDDGTYHHFPIEYWERALAFLSERGYARLGVAGHGYGGMQALLLASFVPRLELVIALSPADFVPQGLCLSDHGTVIPARDMSSHVFRSEPLPYMPFYLSENEYEGLQKKWAKKKHCTVYSLPIYKRMETQYHIPPEARIAVENICGRIVLMGAGDDTVWYSLRYCKRIMARLDNWGFSHPLISRLYDYGAPLLLPQSIVEEGFFLKGRAFLSGYESGRQHAKEGKMTRMDVEETLTGVLYNW